MRRISILLLLLVIAGCGETRSRPESAEAVFFPPLPEIPRIQFLTSISSEADLGKKRDEFREFVTGKPEDLRAIGRAWDVDHVAGKLYVSAKAYRQILIVDLELRKIDFVDSSTGGELPNPGGIFVSNAGYKFVADRKLGQILVFDQLDQFVKSYGLEGEFQPTDVVVIGDRVLATDVSADTIRIFDRRSGELIDSLGGQGDDESTFRYPTHLTVDDQGNLYVTDFMNFRVQKFDIDGSFVKTIGEMGDFPGAMPRPKGIAVDRSGHLFVVDVAFELVQVFDTETGEPLLPFGKFGSLYGGTWLPAGVHVDYDNIDYFSEYLDPAFKAEYLIYVTNQSGPFKINVYAFGEYIKGRSTE